MGDQERAGDFLENKKTFSATLKKIFFIPLAVGGLFALIYLLWFAFSKASGKDVVFFYPKLFGDFTQVAYFSLHKNCYVSTFASSYSALSLMTVAPFAVIFAKDLRSIPTVSSAGEWWKVNLQLLSSWRFWLAYLLFTAFCAALIVVLLRAYIKKRGAVEDTKSVILLFFSSAATLYGFLRGNVILVSLVFVLWFLLWYDDEKAWKREVALVALAVAGVNKLYPLFFCAVLFHEKRWLSIVRAFAYFLLFYTLPAAIYEGGFGAYFENLVRFADGESSLHYTRNVSAASALYKIVFYSLQFFKIAPPSWLNQFCIGFGFCFLPFYALAAIVTKDPLKRSAITLSAMTLVPPVSYFYVAVFAVFPLLEYLKGFEARTRKENAWFLAWCILLGSFPLYAAFLFEYSSCMFAISTAFLFLPGAVCTVKTFGNGDMKEYFSAIRKKYKGEDKHE